VPADPWVAGPAEIHVGVGPGDSLLFLGWTLEGVRITSQPYWAPVRCDDAGMMPRDMLRLGETWTVTAPLAVFDDAVMEACKNRGNPTGAASTQGSMPVGDIGTMMNEEGASYRLLVYPGFFGMPGKMAGQPNNFLRAFLQREDTAPIGTRQKIVHATFQCLSFRDPLTGSFFGWDRNVGGKPAAL
jgi:hypothetical protein